MTIDKAIYDVVNSEEFREKAKVSSTLRSRLKDIRDGVASYNLKINILKQFGYRIEAVKI